MRRSEKIERYLREQKREISVQRLQEKFGLSYREAKAYHDCFFGTTVRSSRFVSLYVQQAMQYLLRVFSTEKRRLVGLFAVAILVRTGYIWSLSMRPELSIPLLDARYYVEWAKRIVETGWIGDRVFFTEPLYAYFLAGFFRWFGNAAEMSVLIVQGLLGATLPIIVYFLAKQLFTVRVALVSGLLAALYGPFVFYEGLLLKTSLEVWTLTLFVCLLLWKFLSVNWKWALGLGMLLGIITLVKGNNIVLWPLLAGAFVWLRTDIVRRKRFLLAGIFTIGVWCILFPVTLRNYIVSHDIVPTNFSAGLAIYQGNWYGGDGTTALVPPFLRPDPKYEETDAIGMAEAFEGKPLQPSEVSSFWIQKAWQEIIADPGHFIGTIGYKALLLVNHGEVSDNYSYDFYRERMPWLSLLPSVWLVLICGLPGLGWFIISKQETFASIAKREDRESWRRKKQLLIIVCIGYVSVLLLTTINSRYRLPFFPFLIIFSGVTLVFLQQSIAERRYRTLRWLTVSILVTTGFSVLPLRVFTAVGEANALYTVGAGYLAQGDEDRATEYFEAAKNADAKYAWAYSSLFSSALKSGDRNRALDNLKQLILIRPDDLSHFDRLKLFKDTEQDSNETLRVKVKDYEQAEKIPVYDPLSYEGERFLKQHDTTRAKELYTQSLEKFGDTPSSLVALASMAKEEKDMLMAKQYYRRALAINPWLLTIRYNLANIAISENDYPAVVELLRDVYVITPELGETWYNYAVALIKTGKNAEAASVAQAYVEHYRDDPSKKEKVDKFEAALKPTTPSVEDMVKQQSKNQ